MSKLAGLDTKNIEDTKNSFDVVINILKEHFVEGKGIGQSGIIEITSEDLGELPAEVITGALSFLSQGLATNRGMPSNMPLEE
jgi:hypothetical protein